MGLQHARDGFFHVLGQGQARDQTAGGCPEALGATGQAGLAH